MSARPFDTFLAHTLLEGIAATMQPGERYQFKSPNADNAQHLFQAFSDLGEIKAFDKHPLLCVPCGSLELITVLHGESPAFGENFISFLRDQVAGRAGQFAQCALLIIHNSMLDTLINSAQDVAAVGGLWSPEIIHTLLLERIRPGSLHRTLFRSMLADQLRTLREEGMTVFGFAPLFNSVEEDVPDLPAMGLFPDLELLEKKNTPALVKARLQENRELHRKLEHDVERFAGNLDGILTEFSTRFIREHFETKNDWSTLDYGTYLVEMESNRTAKLALEKIEAPLGTMTQRAKSLTAAGQRDVSLILELPKQELPGQAELIFTFLGSDLTEKQVVIRHHEVIAQGATVEISRTGGKRSRLGLKVPFGGAPAMFTLELDRLNRSEEFKFRVLLVEQGTFYLGSMKNCFRVEPKKGGGRITLQLEENQLRVAEQGETIQPLGAEATEADVATCAIVDFETLASRSESIQFDLVSGDHRLPIHVEGPPAGQSLSLPLLLAKGRMPLMLTAQGHGEYLRDRKRILVDHSELAVVFERQTLLEFEADLIQDMILYRKAQGDPVTVGELAAHYPDLAAAYEALFHYYRDHNTLPSLAAWDQLHRNLVATLLDTFELALQSIPKNQVLTGPQRMLLFLGLHETEGRERLNPLHPILLAYYLELVDAIQKEYQEQETTSIADLPAITMNRLVASGLLPLVYHGDRDYAHIQPVRENPFWLDVVPQKGVSHSYIQRLVRDKLAEFTRAYGRLFTAGGTSGLILNAVNQGDAKELFDGLVDYFKVHKDDPTAIHVNFYDEALNQNAFDRFSETRSYGELKDRLGLTTGPLREESDLFIDLLRSRLTYSKFKTPRVGESFAYAHLAFFSNNVPVDCRPVVIEEALSGVMCQGLMAGEASETQGESYFTAFGLRGLDAKTHRPLRMARLIGSLWQPARQTNCQYLGQGIGLAVSSDFKELLFQSYESALWTTIIDPKVNLDFFASQKDAVIIHYSDQYTSSSGYDAITVTKQVDLFQRLLEQDCLVDSARLLDEFNAFNGEWLLRMLTSTANERKEKYGIIGAYKFGQALLRESDICWIPLSVAEMIRVSGNVGLKMSESDFSRHLQGYRQGAISDDVLFVGFKGDRLYLLPLEVKTAKKPDREYAGKQARELKRFLEEDLLGPKTLAGHLYRGLFIRQVLMQVEKLRLYGVLDAKDLGPLLDRREWWLGSTYELGALPGYAEGFVLSHVDQAHFREAEFKRIDGNILQIDLPYSLLPDLMEARTEDALEAIIRACQVPSDCFLRTGSDAPKPPSPRKVTPIMASPEKGLASPEEMAAPRQAPEQPLPPTVEEMPERATSTPPKPVIPIPLPSPPPSLAPEALAKPLMSGSAPLASSDPAPIQVLFGHDALRQTPCFWEPTNTTKCMNPNTGIIGTMGTGKTQFTKSLVAQVVQQQSRNVDGVPIGMLIFDYKADYVDSEFIKATGATTHQLFKLPYNPLALFGDVPMLPIHTASAFAETLTRAFGLGQRQQLNLEQLILACYEDAGISSEDPATWGRPAPTIEDLWQRYTAQDKVDSDSLHAALRKLAVFKIFEDDPAKLTSLFDLVQGVMVIELSGKPIEVQNLIVALTLDLFYAQMHKQGKPVVQGDFRQLTKLILVDEADNFMKQDFASLRRILKEGREYGVGVILSTQEITHFKTTENNYANSILTWVIHRVAELKNADLKSIFNIDDRSEQERLMGVIRKLDKHQSLYVDGSKRFLKIKDKPFWELSP